jgi:hypothetical protein
MVRALWVCFWLEIIQDFKYIDYLYNNKLKSPNYLITILVGCSHRLLIEVDCSLVIKHNSKLNGFQTLQMSQVFLALISS